MTYNVLAKRAVRRAGRLEDPWLGTFEADSREDAERIAAKNWPGTQLTVATKNRVIMPPRKNDAPRPARSKSVGKRVKSKTATKAVGAPATGDKPLTIVIGLGSTPAGLLRATVVGPEQQNLGLFEFANSATGYRSLKAGLTAIAHWRNSPLLRSANYQKLKARFAAIAKEQGGVQFHFRLLRTIRDADKLLPFLHALPWPITITHDEPMSDKPPSQRFPMRRIPIPDWAGDHARGEVRLNCVTQAEYESLQQRRREILALLDAEVERYVSDNAEAGGDSFPDRNRLTGEFYIGHETYYKQAEPVWFRISIFCRCLQHRDNWPDDYLGLEVYMRCEPNGGVCSVLDVDSSSI